MTNNINKYYFWTNSNRDVTALNKRCDSVKEINIMDCKIANENHENCYTSVSKVVSIDVGQSDKDDEGCQYIFTVQCELTKYTGVYLIRAKVSQNRSFVIILF